MPVEQQSASLARTAAVHFCYSLSQLAHAADDGGGTDAAAPSDVPAPVRLAASEAGAMLLRSMVAASEADSDMRAVVPFKGSAVHRKKTRLWQALAVLAPFHKEAVGSLSLEGVLGTLQQGEIASIKQYQEAGVRLFVWQHGWYPAG